MNYLKGRLLTFKKQILNWALLRLGLLNEVPALSISGWVGRSSGAKDYVVIPFIYDGKVQVVLLTVSEVLRYQARRVEFDNEVGQIISRVKILEVVQV